MKPIKITAKTAESIITKELDEIQARCKVRTIDFRDIELALNEVQRRIGVPKKSLEGTTVTIDVHAQNFPSAYKFVPESTLFSAEFSGGAWRVTRIWRDTCRRGSQRATCTLSDTAKQAVLDNLHTFDF